MDDNKSFTIITCTFLTIIGLWLVSTEVFPLNLDNGLSPKIEKLDSVFTVKSERLDSLMQILIKENNK